MGMTREGAIKGLLEVADWHYGKYEQTREEDYLDDGDFLTAVANMLKAQEPRVMTLEEAKNAYVVEYRSGKMREVGSALLDLNVDPLNAEYGKIYRVWTSRPTDEQREAIPWE